MSRSTRKQEAELRLRETPGLRLQNLREKRLLGAEEGFQFLDSPRLLLVLLPQLRILLVLVVILLPQLLDFSLLSLNHRVPLLKRLPEFLH